MRNSFLLFAVAIGAAVLSTGCANVERKFGRGVSNSHEIIRGAELRRSMEQTAIFDSPDHAYTTGFVRGMNRTLARTGIGIYEIFTAPFPPYGPVATRYLAPDPVYPDNNRPDLAADSTYATDTYTGFSGGTILPLLPGNRFRVLDGQ
jgi:putative exosortase-associated protein (TIGR04073 family)